MDGSKIEGTKSTPKSRQLPFRTCYKHSLHLPCYQCPPLLLFTNRIMPTQICSRMATVLILIIPVTKEQSDLDFLCVNRTICLKSKDLYSRYSCSVFKTWIAEQLIDFITNNNSCFVLTVIWYLCTLNPTCKILAVFIKGGPICFLQISAKSVQRL